MTKRARILYDIHPRTVGGTEQFLARLLPRLDTSRFDPMVVSARAGAPLQMVASLDIATRTVGTFFTRQGVRDIARLIRRERVDLVQSNYYSSQLALAAATAGVPHVWRLGGHVAYGSGAAHRADEHSTLQMIRLLSTTIVCNSRYVRRQFTGRSGRPPIDVIANGVALFDGALSARAGGPVRVTMAAHFTPQKRHEDFIRAAALIRKEHGDVEFTIYGREYGYAESRRYAATIRRLAARLLPPGTVRFVTFGSRNPGAIARSDVVVLTSVGESLSNALLEAMAAGIPVVAARSGGTPEIVVHGRTGVLVPPESPDALAAAVRSLVKDPRRRVRFGRAGRARARTVFSMDRCVRRYESLYDGVLGRRES